MIEWECTLACNFNCSYCTNGRNQVIGQSIKAGKDYRRFIECILKPLCKDDTLFLFGGEPALHPYIDDIVACLNDNNIDFMIQTNFSRPDIIIKLDCKTRVSIHKELDYKCYTRLPEVKHLLGVDVMYDGPDAIKRLKLAQRFTDKAILVPVADFDGTQKHLDALRQFNVIKRAGILPCEGGTRSYTWQEFVEGKRTTIGKPCVYRTKYTLFDPAFNQWHCSHRINTDICKHNCFLM